MVLALVAALLLSGLLPDGATFSPPSALPLQPDAEAHPAANITLPSIGANTTGFAVTTADLALAGNRGLRVVSPIPQLPANLSSNATLVLALGEPINSSVSVFIGFAEGEAFGLSAAVPFSYVNDSGTVTVGTGPYLLPPGATLHTFSFQEVHGPWWTFTVDGNLLTGGPDSQGNGTYDLGSTSASAFAATLPPAPSLAFVVTGNHSPAPSLPLPEALSYLGTGGWVNATSADSVLDQGVGLAGYLQDPTIPPGALEVAPGSPSLPPLTALWDTGPLPGLSLNVTKLPASVPAGTDLTLRAWANATGGTGVAANLTVTDALGAMVTASPGGTVGTFLIRFQTPGVSAPTSDTLTLRATAPGFVGRVRQAQTNITPSNLSLVGPPGAQSVLSSGTLLLSYSLVNAQGGAWTASAANVTLLPPEGSAQVLAPGTAPTGSIQALYHAPMVEVPVRVNLTLSAVAPGFSPVSAITGVTVLPRPLAITVLPPPTLSPGQNFSLRLEVSGPGLGPGPLDNGTWTSSGGGPTPGGVTLGPFEGLGYGNVSVPLHVSSNFTGNLTLQLRLTVPGYTPALASLSIGVIANATLVVKDPPRNLAAGSQGIIHVQVLTPFPVANGMLVLTTSEGTWVGGAGSTLRVPVPPNGSVRAVLEAPLDLVTGSSTVRVTLEAMGFHAAGAEWVITVHPSWQSFFGQAWAYPLIVGVGLALALLAVWVVRRRRSGTSPPGPATSAEDGYDEAPGAAGASQAPEYSEGGEEGPPPGP